METPAKSRSRYHPRLTWFCFAARHRRNLFYQGNHWRRDMAFHSSIRIDRQRRGRHRQRTEPRSRCKTIDDASTRAKHRRAPASRAVQFARTGQHHGRNDSASRGCAVATKGAGREGKRPGLTQDQQMDSSGAGFKKHCHQGESSKCEEEYSCASYL
jgi:hypothetical protein